MSNTSPDTTGGINGEHNIPAPGGAGNTAAKSPWYLSTILWTNLAALASMLLPAVRDWLAANPIELTSALGAINILLGFGSSGRLRLTGAAPSTPPAEPAGCDSAARSNCPTAAECRDMGLTHLAEAPGGPDTDARMASPSSIPSGAAGASAIKTSALLTLGALMSQLLWAQSTPAVAVTPPVVQSTSK